MKTSEPPIIIETFFNSSKEEVWKAITEPEKMRQWFFEQIKDFKPEVGFETQFMVRSETRDFPHYWKVTEVINKEKITYNWTYPIYKGNSYVTFELSETQDQTKLILTTRITEDFPDDIPEFKRESCIGGWDYFLKQRLKDYLD